MNSIASKTARLFFGAVLMGSLLPACVSRRQYTVAKADLDRINPKLAATCATSSVEATRDPADTGPDDEPTVFIKACSIDRSSIRPTPNPAYVSVTASSERTLVYAGAVVGVIGVVAVPTGVAVARSGTLTTTTGPGLIIMGLGGAMAVTGGVMALVGAFTTPHELDPKDEPAAMTPKVALTPGGVNVEVPLW